MFSAAPLSGDGAPPGALPVQEGLGARRMEAWDIGVGGCIGSDRVVCYGRCEGVAV